jgi:hypothetical protein
VLLRNRVDDAKQLVESHELEHPSDVGLRSREGDASMTDSFRQVQQLGEAGGAEEIHPGHVDDGGAVYFVEHPAGCRGGVFIEIAA